MSKKDSIRIQGAREHNLRSVSTTIPKEKMVVITGPSGSGKSSLALDTLYNEGKRRYVESLSAYARQFLGVAKKPLVDSIEGLCPAIAIEQKTVGFNPRSTVGTITEIYDYLRVLFARAGAPHCPSCHKLIESHSPQSLSEMILEAHKGKKVSIASPIGIERKGEFVNDILSFYEKGILHFFIDGKKYRFPTKEEIMQLSLAKQKKHSVYAIADTCVISPEEKERVAEAVEKALSSKGCATLIFEDGSVITYSSMRVCLSCVTSCPELEPRLFSFNSPIGACPTCHGLGEQYFFQNQNFGDGREDGNSVACVACRGARLNKEALSVTIGEKNIYDLCMLPLDELSLFLEDVFIDAPLVPVAQPLLQEIKKRLSFLSNVGLSYLTLARTARELSGGEGQRIRLATQLGSALTGVMYILDEPSIGLHQRDNDQLISTLKSLRDQGNTVIVVEHDLDTIRQADFVIDMGPGAGIHGGTITAQGTPEELSSNLSSLTGAFLSGRRCIPVPSFRRAKKGELVIEKVKTNNLKEINVSFPLGVMCAVSGVSGSGKSSLVIDTLAPALHSFFMKGYFPTLNFEHLTGINQLKSMVMVDQTPIGRTPRSNPATYVGIFNDIRTLFSQLPESNARGYAPGRFSFNVSDGRCFECNGEGSIKVSMHFLEDVILECKACKGRRYNQQTLEIKFKGKNIADILDMSVEEAGEFFKHIPPIAKKIQLLSQVGLGYLTLGQSSITLSGGEAQRIKLADELSKRGKDTLYILDEPTTGLHSADIEKLLIVLNKLVDKGNSVLIIEHNLDVLKTVDYIIDIGPEGGRHGGTIVAQGTPEEVSSVAASYTGRYLKTVL